MGAELNMCMYLKQHNHAYIFDKIGIIFKEF